MTTLEWNRNIICQLANENVTWIYTEIEIKNNTAAGVKLPTSPYISKDKGGLVNLPNN